MANPTGTTYLTENTGYVWTDGDVYEIVQTDQQEGAAVGASFSGLGVDNQPHQVLLNKLKLTHTKQLTDEANIAALQAFEALFTSSMKQNGWLKLGVLDTSLGLIAPLIQWGTVIYNQSITNDTLFTMSWNVPFPSAFLFALGMPLRSGSNTSPDGNEWTLEFIGGTVTQGSWELNKFSAQTNSPFVYGFNWFAIGY